MYIATRSDLSLGSQAAQIGHCAFEFSMQWPHVTSDWFTRSNYLICVACPDEASLAQLATKAALEGIAHTIVREPDLCNEITAVGLEPGDVSRRLCANLGLVGRMPGYSVLAGDKIRAQERTAVPG